MGGSQWSAIDERSYAMGGSCYAVIGRSYAVNESGYEAIGSCDAMIRSGFAMNVFEVAVESMVFAVVGNSNALNRCDAVLVFSRRDATKCIYEHYDVSCRA